MINDEFSRNCYESPIELIAGNLQTQIEDNCLKTIQSYGFNIDKEELRKALEYDRDQYDKGYADARKRYERPSGEWIVGEYMDCHSDILPKYTCPFCGEVVYRRYDFCHCGADMRGGEE